MRCYLSACEHSLVQGDIVEGAVEPSAGGTVGVGEAVEGAAPDPPVPEVPGATVRRSSALGDEGGVDEQLHPRWPDRGDGVVPLVVPVVGGRRDRDGVDCVEAEVDPATGIHVQMAIV